MAEEIIGLGRKKNAILLAEEIAVKPVFDSFMEQAEAPILKAIKNACAVSDTGEELNPAAVELRENKYIAPILDNADETVSSILEDFTNMFGKNRISLTEAGKLAAKAGFILGEDVAISDLFDVAEVGSPDSDSLKANIRLSKIGDCRKALEEDVDIVSDVFGNLTGSLDEEMLTRHLPKLVALEIGAKAK